MAHHTDVGWPLGKKYGRIDCVTFGSLVIQKTSVSIFTETRSALQMAAELATVAWQIAGRTEPCWWTRLAIPLFVAGVRVL